MKNSQLVMLIFLCYFLMQVSYGCPRKCYSNVNERVSGCRNETLGDDLATCSNYESYLTCLNKLNLDDDQTLKATKVLRNQLVEIYKSFKGLCNDADLLNKCLTKNNYLAPTMNCSLVGGDRFCYNVPHLNKTTISIMKKTQSLVSEKKSCFENQVINYCQQDYLNISSIPCGEVGSVKNCLQHFYEQYKIPSSLEIFQPIDNRIERCKATAAIEACFEKHADLGANVTCDTVGPYLECVKAVDTEGYKNVKAHQESILFEFAQFKAKCEDKKNDCWKAQGRNINCKRATLLMACLQDIPLTAPLRVRKFLVNCESKFRLDKCFDSFDPKEGTACNYFRKLVDCFNAVDVIPGFQSYKDEYIWKNTLNRNEYCSRGY